MMLNFSEQYTFKNIGCFLNVVVFSSGKTVLLFQAAVAYASEGRQVTLISRRPLSRMPHSVHGMIRPEAAGNLQTLTFLLVFTFFLKICLFFI